MINTSKIKTILIRVLGESITSYIQSIRFVYLVRKQQNHDSELDYIQHFLKNGDVAIDVGANGADWTEALHRHVGKDGRVFAFEADPYYAKATNLAIKFMRLKNVTFFGFGLSDKDGGSYLKIYDSKNQRISGTGYVNHNADCGDPVFVPIILKRLDSLVDTCPELLKASLMKLDVEGHELNILKGANILLQKARPILILEVGNYEKHGYSSSDLHDFLVERNYCAFAVINNERLEVTDRMLNHKKAKSVNRIIIPKEKVKYFDDFIDNNI